MITIIFFCNQTEENGGFACFYYTGYEGNKFYLTEATIKYEFKNKFCPCFPNCTLCDNEKMKKYVKNVRLLFFKLIQIMMLV